MSMQIGSLEQSPCPAASGLQAPDIKILALTRYGRLGASSRLRTFQYRGPLAGLGIELDIRPLFGDDYVNAIYGDAGRARVAFVAVARRLKRLLSSADHDALWVEKEALPWLPAFLELALLPSRMPLILDYDDAVFHRYDMHRSRMVRALLGAKLDRLMARADLVVAGNDYLAARARQAGARQVEIVPTVVDLDRYPVRPGAGSDRLTVGWIGSPGTASYLDVVKPVLRGLSETMPLKAIAIGARADQLAGSPFETAGWSEESEVDVLRTIDIGIMPLQDTPWERGKCGYKLIQYMALGLPVVASPVGVNVRIVRSGVNGFLATTADDWHAALARLAGDAALRAAFGGAGRSDVEKGYALSVQAPRLAAMIAAAVGARGRRSWKN